MEVEFPIEVSDIKFKTRNPVIDHSRIPTGSLVRIRPCADECKGRTYAGIFLGEMPLRGSVGYDPDTKELTFMSTFYNPAIFVPSLKKIVYGAESWWGEIKSLEELDEITTDDIEDIWYVKMAREMFAGAAKEEKESEIDKKKKLLAELEADDNEAETEAEVETEEEPTDD